MPGPADPPDRNDRGDSTPPRGIYPCRVDDKGRLKLPAAFQHFLAAAGETAVFVTSLDHRVARIYPMAVWQRNEELLQDVSTDRNTAETILFVANDLGGVVEVDPQGRILLPAVLRHRLDMQQGTLYLTAYRGHIQLMTEQTYQQRRERALADSEEALRRMEKQGFE